MKINKAKLLVGTMAMVAAVATAGSISGTFAWWANSYRAIAELDGATARVSELLEIKTADLDGESKPIWKTNLEKADILKLAKAKDASRDNMNLFPVAYSTVDVIDANPVNNVYAKDVAIGQNTIKAHPTYQQGAYANWKVAPITDYVQFDLEFRVSNGSTASDTSYDIYLNDLTILEKAVANKEDISDAIRVHIHAGDKNILLGKGTTTATTFEATNNGNLDLGGRKGKLDRDGKGYSFSNNHGNLVNYGAAAGSKQTIYSASSASNGIYPTAYTDGKVTGGKSLGQVTKTASLVVTFTIFLDGWQELAADAGATTDRFFKEYASDEAYNTAVANGSYVPELGDVIKIGNDLKVCTTAKAENVDPVFGAYEKSSVWDIDSTEGAAFNLGMTFDAGIPNNPQP